MISTRKRNRKIFQICAFVYDATRLTAAVLSRTLLCRKHTTSRFMHVSVKKDNGATFANCGLICWRLSYKLRSTADQCISYSIDCSETHVHEIHILKEHGPLLSSAACWVNYIEKLFFLVSICSRWPMSASYIGKVPAEIAALIFDYAVDPVGPPVPTAPTEWPRRDCRLPDGCIT